MATVSGTSVFFQRVTFRLIPHNVTLYNPAICDNWCRNHCMLQLNILVVACNSRETASRDGFRFTQLAARGGGTWGSKLRVLLGRAVPGQLRRRVHAQLHPGQAA